MADELSAAIYGAVAGAVAAGIVTAAIDGIKSWRRRPQLRMAASMAIAKGPTDVSQYSFSLTMTNTGGETLHIVRCGILGPCRPNLRQAQIQRRLGKLRKKGVPFSQRWTKPEELSELLAFERDVIVLAPGQPYSIKGVSLFDYFGLELNGEGYAFALDSLGRYHKCKFKPVDYEILKRSRTQEEQADIEKALEQFRNHNERPGLSFGVRVQGENKK